MQKNFRFYASGGSPLVVRGITVPGTYNKVIAKFNEGSLTRKGFTFNGWNTKADGSGTAYKDGDQFAALAAGVVLFAQWVALPTFTVTYNGNTSTGGSVPVDSKTYVAGDRVATLPNYGTLVKTSNTFLGWNTQADGLGTFYNPQDMFNMPASNVTLYAVWKVTATYTLTYAANVVNGGTPPVDATAYANKQVATVAANTGALIKTGYVLLGWVDNVTGIFYGIGSKIAMVTNVTLTTVWSLVDAQSVIYDKNGADVTGATPVDLGTYGRDYLYSDVDMFTAADYSGNATLVKQVSGVDFL